MSHKPSHMIKRGRSFSYNRRVPDAVAGSFGCKHVRLNLGADFEQAVQMSKALTSRLDELWCAPVVVPIDPKALLEQLQPRVLDLVTCTEMYLSSRQIDEKPVWLAVNRLLEFSGNRAVSSYARSDARQVVDGLLRAGNKTGTVRRRVQSLHAVLEFGCNRPVLAAL